MVNAPNSTVGALDSARSLIERGQQRVDQAAARIGRVPPVPKAEPAAEVRERGRELDTSSNELPRTGRQDLVRDTVELSRGSFEVKAGATVARIQQEIDDAVNSIGGRLDITF